MRDVARTELPSTKAATTAARFAVVSLFMGCIMRERSRNVNHAIHNHALIGHGWTQVSRQSGLGRNIGYSCCFRVRISEVWPSLVHFIALHGATVQCYPEKRTGGTGYPFHRVSRYR